MRRLLASDFGIWPTPSGNLFDLSESLAKDPDYWSRLANYILLYDQIIIPTGNLQVLAVIRRMLGDDILQELIRARVIVFARFDEWLAYRGDGSGLVFFRVERRKNDQFTLGHAFHTPLDETIDIVFKQAMPSTFGAVRKRELKKILIDNVVSIPLEAVTSDLITETYNDILNSPYLRDMLAIRNAGRSLKSLVGIRSNQMTVFNPYRDNPENPEVRSVLRAGFENLLFCMGGYANVDDITADPITHSMLLAKGQRLGFSVEGENSFTEIQKVSGVPNIGAAFAKKQLNAEALIKLRSSDSSHTFRNWLAAGAPREEASDTVRRYIDSLDKVGFVDSLPVKLLRFAVTTGIGALDPAAGLVANVADSFFLNKWFPERSPKLFMEEAKLVMSQASAIPHPGTLREAPYER